MITFRLQTPPHLIVGREIATTAARELRRSGARRALMITEAVLAGSGSAERMREAFEDAGLSVASCTGFDSGSLSDTAGAALDLARAGYVDAVIGFGTSTTLSLARFVGALLRSDMGVDEALDSERPLDAGVPMVAIPSEPFDPLLFSAECLVVDARNRSARLLRRADAPTYVLMDAEVLEGMTPMQGYLATASALLQSVEGLLSRRRTVLSIPLHTEAIDRAVRILDRSDASGESRIEGDPFESQVLDVSLLTAYASRRIGLGPGTALSAAIHARRGLGVIAACSALAGPAAATMVRAAPEAAKGIAERIGASEATPERIEARIRELFGAHDLPLRLRDLGLSGEESRGLGGTVETLDVLGRFGAVGVADSAAIVEAAL